MTDEDLDWLEARARSGHQTSFGDLDRLIKEVRRLREVIERLQQVASGNDERIALLAKKHGGRPFDAARLAALQDAVAHAFPRVDGTQWQELLEISNREVERLRARGDSFAEACRSLTKDNTILKSELSRVVTVMCEVSEELVGGWPMHGRSRDYERWIANMAAKLSRVVLATDKAGGE